MATLRRKTRTNDVIVGHSADPRLSTVNLQTNEHKEMFEEAGTWGVVKFIDFAKTLNQLFITTTNSPGLQKVDPQTGVIASSSTIMSNPAYGDLSPDETMMLLSKSAAANASGILILDTTSLTPVSGAPTNFASHGSKWAVFSPDGQFLIVVNNTGYNVYVYETTNWTQVSTFAQGTNGTTSGIARSKDPTDGNYICTWGSGTNGMRIWDLDNNNAEVINLTTILNTSYNKAIFGHTSEEVIAIHSANNGALISVFDIANGTRQPLTMANEDTTQPTFITDINLSDDGLILYVLSFEGLFRHRRASLTSAFDTGEIVTRLGDMRSIGIVSGVKWEVIGNIDENLAETQWLCEAFDLISGSPLGSVVTSTTAFTIPLGSPDPVRVTVSPVAFDVWRASTDYGLNQKVYPTDPQSTPYYYKCTTSGTSGSTEPVFPVVTGGTVTDGTVVWELVERIIQPISHQPLIPTVVP